MRSLHVLLAASLALALSPTALAAETNCVDDPPNEGLAHPLKKGSYLFIAGSDGTVDAEKFGEWSETNIRGGLQTSVCFAFGQPQYGADRQAKLLP